MGVGDWARRVMRGSFRATPSPEKKPDAEGDVALWFARIFAAQRLASFEFPAWQKLEYACDGMYPNVVGTTEEDTKPQFAYDLRLRSGDQLDVNLMGRALKKKLGDAYDDHVALKFARRPSADAEVCAGLEKLAEKLMDEGMAADECRRAMALAHTRGQSVVWPMFVRNAIQESEIVAGKIPVGDFLESALAGNPPIIPLGADYDGIIRALKNASLPFDQAGRDNPSYYALTEDQKANLSLWILKAEKAKKKANSAPHPIQPRAKIYFEATPYGSWCLVDSSVTDFSKVGWIARKIVMTPEEFRRDPTFTDEAKENVPVASISSTSSSGTPSSTSITITDPTSGKVADEWGRVVLWEIWDKIGWRRLYVAQGYAKFCGKSDRYPYMDTFGRPLFPDFFPCVWRTPWMRMVESTRRVLGLPGLEPMYPSQIEYIKCITAFVLACKSTARIFLVGPGVDQATLEAVAQGQDCTFVKATKEFSPQMQGKMAEQFVQMPMSQAPIDYLNAADKVKHEAYESVGISFAAMTASPQAETATQESLIAQGASSTSDSEIAVFEDGYAELAWKALAMFLEFSNEQEFQAYLGAKALEPRPPRQAPQPGPDGQMIPAQPEPSLYEAMTTTDLVGERLEARFAATDNAQSMMRSKQLMDALTLVNNVRDGAGMPYKDPKDIMNEIMTSLDVEAADYQPSEGEIAMQVSGMMDNRNKGDGGGGDDRLANGQRGQATGAQTRGKGLGRGGPGAAAGHFAGAQASGVGLRRANSPNQ